MVVVLLLLPRRMHGVIHSFGKTEEPVLIGLDQMHYSTWQTQPCFFNTTTGTGTTTSTITAATAATSTATRTVTIRTWELCMEKCRALMIVF